MNTVNKKIVIYLGFILFKMHAPFKYQSSINGGARIAHSQVLVIASYARASTRASVYVHDNTYGFNLIYTLVSLTKWDCSKEMGLAMLYILFNNVVRPQWIRYVTTERKTEVDWFTFHFSLSKL